MTSLKILALGLTASVSLSACGNSTLKEMAAVRDKICKCKDKACIEEIQKDSKDLEARMKGLSEDEQKKALTIALEIMECTSKIEG